MKTLLIGALMLFMLTACTNESQDSLSGENASSAANGSNLKGPGNVKNPYDYKGKQFYDALMEYRSENDFPNSLQAIKMEISFSTRQFKKENLYGRSLIPFNDQIVDSIMSDPDLSMLSIVAGSSLQQQAKISLTDFITGLITHRTSGFNTAYDYITDYEGTITGNQIWSEDERETMLTITSISRYSLYSETARKDRDWEKSAGNKPVRAFFEVNQAALIYVIAISSLMLPK